MSAVYGYVTEKIISLLEAGTVPWERPWNGPAGWPKNLVSGKEYRGINTFLLSATGYTSPYWLTFNQAKAKGASIRAGEKSSMVVFYKMLDVTKPGKEGTRVDDQVPMLRYYRVFNVAQCDGLTLPTVPEPVHDIPPHERADRMLSDLDARGNGPTVAHGKGRACYIPARDLIEMPDRTQFHDQDAYYRVRFHELTHATGHASRLNRPEIAGTVRYGSGDYGREELTAEMGAAFLCGRAGLDGREERSASYLAAWIKTLKGEPRMVVQAASKAQKAADWIMAD